VNELFIVTLNQYLFVAFRHNLVSLITVNVWHIEPFSSFKL